MNILILEWPAFGNETIKHTFETLGHSVSGFEFPYDSPDAKNGEGLCARLVGIIMKEKTDIVFSFNFFPAAATAAHACRCRYVSWVYDNPAVFLYSVTVFFPENHIFHFDSYEVERMRRDGVEHVYYLPLAGNPDVYDKIVPSESDRMHYAADVAMLGSLYTEKYGYFGKYSHFDDYMKGFFDALVNGQEDLYGVNILQQALTPEIMERIFKALPLKRENGDGYENPEWIIANYYLAMRVTEQARRHMLEAMAERYDVAMYTGSDVSGMKGVRKMGSAEYYKEAPLAIKCAKVNLNVTLRSIQNGIPLRIMDIMSCGGFVLSNYQYDLCEAFVPGEDFVCYESREDAVEKAGYYLEHEDERLRIAENGYRKVKERHSFMIRCRQMLECMGEA
ncbi:MAG: glycosyltransferase [Lachnospiraceae bacterium]|nr:glycosyltransferase [Lachnospiraceae bacterium]